MSQNNILINVSTLTSEERRQLFLALFDADPSLPNVLNSEQRHCLYSVLIAIDSSLLPYANNVICGVTNEQNDLRNRAASRFSRGEALSPNPTFPISEADFVLHDWLTSYCNSMVDQVKKQLVAEAKDKGLLPPSPKKKNVRPPPKLKHTDHEATNASQDYERNSGAFSASNTCPNTTISSLAYQNTTVSSPAHPNTKISSPAHPNTTVSPLSNPNTTVSPLSNPNTKISSLAYQNTTVSSPAHPNTT
ncbi:7156_t:CDS:2, partial [Funneliformis geosporum]